MTGALRAVLRGLLAVVATTAICMPGAAAACTTAELIATQIRQESPSVEIRLVGDPVASRLGIGISALVGQLVPSGGQYLLAHVPGSLTSYVVRFEAGCATHHGRFSRELVRAWLEGSPA
jgi:hypothetical protein